MSDTLPLHLRLALVEGCTWLSYPANREHAAFVLIHAQRWTAHRHQMVRRVSYPQERKAPATL